MEHRDNKEVMMEALKLHAWSFEYLSDRLRDDKEVAMVAVNRDAKVLKYASDRLRADREVVLTAIRMDTSALEFASEDLKNDRVIASLVYHSKGYQYLSLELRKDKALALQAVKAYPPNYQKVHKSIREDFDVLATAIVDGYVELPTLFFKIPEEIKSNKEFILKIESFLEIFQDEHKKEYEFLQQVIREKNLNNKLNHMNKDLKVENIKRKI